MHMLKLTVGMAYRCTCGLCVRHAGNNIAVRKLTEFFKAPPKHSQQDSSTGSSLSTDYRPAACSEGTTAAFSEATTSATDSTNSESYAQKGKHKIGYNASWEAQFNWLKRVEEGMLCSICNKFNLLNSRNKFNLLNSRNKTSVWFSEPCRQLRKDKVVQHSQSEMHATAVEREISYCIHFRRWNCSSLSNYSVITEESYNWKYAYSLLVGKRRSCTFYKI